MSGQTPGTWPTARGQPLFQPPAVVEILNGTTYLASQTALAALAKDWRAGFEDDRHPVSGQLRITLPVSGHLVFLARGRGHLGSLRVNGEPPGGLWLGLDAGHSPGWPGREPRGWHPFVFYANSAGPILIDTGALRLSLLVCRPTGGP